MTDNEENRMRRKDIKVGEEYAVGGLSRYDRQDFQRVRVLELGVDRETTAYHGGWPHTSTLKDGVRVELLDNCTGTVLSVCADVNHGARGGLFTRDRGSSKAVAGTKYVHQLWAEYVKEHDADNKKRLERDEQRGRQRASAELVQTILGEHGVIAVVNRHRASIAVEFDELHKLATLLATFKAALVSDGS